MSTEQNQQAMEFLSRFLDAQESMAEDMERIANVMENLQSVAMKYATMQGIKAAARGKTPNARRPSPQAANLGDMIGGFAREFFKSR